MDWLQVVPVLLFLVVFLYVPGVSAGLILRLRGYFLFALAPAISVAAVVIVSFCLQAFNVWWRPLPVFAAVLALTTVVALLLRVLKVVGLKASNAVIDPAFQRYLISLTILTGLIVSGLFMRGVVSPENFAQSNDSIFHLNAIRYIQDTTNYSAMRVGLLTSDTPWFYPNVWHLIAALAGSAAGVSVPVAVAGITIFTLAFIWIPGIFFLTLRVAGKSYAALAVAALLSFAIPAYPFWMLIYGVLYAYFFGLAFLPIAIVLTLECFSFVERRRLCNLPLAIILTFTIAGAAAFAHPSVAFSLLLFIAALLAARYILTFRQRSTVERTRGIAPLLAVSVLIVGLQLVLARRNNYQGAVSIGEGIWRTVALSPEDYGHLALVSFLAAIGFFYAWHKRDSVAIALGFSTIIFSILFFIALSVSYPDIRALTDVWYADHPRLAAVAAIFLIPATGWAAQSIWQAIGAKKKDRLLGVFLLVGFISATLLSAELPAVNRWLRTNYEMHADARVVNQQEYELIERLPSHVPEGERVFAIPDNGGSLVYALTGLETLYPHIFMDKDHDLKKIFLHYDRAATDPEVCELVRENKVWHALVFNNDNRFYWGGSLPVSLENLRHAEGFELIDQEGAARLYRLNICR